MARVASCHKKGGLSVFVLFCFLNQSCFRAISVPHIIGQEMVLLRGEAKLVFYDVNRSDRQPRPLRQNRCIFNSVASSQ